MSLRSPETVDSTPHGTTVTKSIASRVDWTRCCEWSAVALLLLLALIVYASRMVMSLRVHLYVDDAYIHMRFARHLAQGLGLVWNVGEAPVEGFTSFFYVLLLAGLERVGIEPIAVSAWFGLLCTVTVAWLTWHLAKLVNPQGKAENLLAVALLLLTPPLVLWTPAGLETPLFTALVTASALGYLLFRQRRLAAWRVSLLFLLATWTRHEAALLFGLTVALEGIVRWRTNRRVIDREMLALVGPYAVVFSIFLVWRWSYFGYPLPNTYYAKTGAGVRQIMGGIDYLMSNLAYLIAGITVVVGLLWSLVRSRPVWNYQTTYLLLLLLFSWIGIVINGGDHFLAGRFMVPTLPLFFVLLACALTHLLSNSMLSVVLKISAVMALTAVAMLFWRPLQWVKVGISSDQNQERVDVPIGGITAFVVMGQTLVSVASQGDSIAVVPIGAIGYFSNLTVIDMVGIVDPVIAHEPFDPVYTASWRPGHDKGNGAYVLSRRPTFVQLVDRLTPAPQPKPDEYALQYKSVVEIWASEAFHRDYEYYPLRVPGGWYYNLYRRIAP